MTRGEAQIVLESDFYTRWSNETPVAYANTNFESAGRTEWTRHNVMFTTINQMTMGYDCDYQRQNGFLNLQFSVALDNGSRRTNELLDKAINLYSGVRVGDILIHTPDVNIIGEVNGWYVSDIDFDFEFEFTRQ